jgi:hypothetical protein
MSVLIPAALTAVIATSTAPAVDLPPPPPQAVRAVEQDEGVRRFALIVVGLPGDDEHAGLFRQTAGDWRGSLNALGVRDDRLFVVAGSHEGDRLTGASGENVREAVARVTEQLRTDDALWVFFLGHGSHDGQHAWFHLPGPDLHEGDWADLFARINCREQVFWFTQSASGGFVRALSRPDRIVIAATAPTGEVNETRFPHVLADVLRNAGPEMDADEDGRLSVLELFRATNARVASYFEENELAATEHAQLDDNGDGRGSEAEGLIEPGVEQHVGESVPDSRRSGDRPAYVTPRIDGALAAETYITTIPAAEDSTGGDE